MASLDCERRFGIVLVLGIGIAQPFLSSIVLGIVLVCRPWYSPSLLRGVVTLQTHVPQYFYLLTNFKMYMYL